MDTDCPAPLVRVKHRLGRWILIFCLFSRTHAEPKEEKIKNKKLASGFCCLRDSLDGSLTSSLPQPQYWSLTSTAHGEPLYVSVPGRL